MTAITLKKIDTEIAAFTTNRDKLRDQAHAIAMLIFLHAAPKEVGPDCQGTGDCTRAIKLAKAMPKSWGEQMVQWFRAYTPIRIVIANEKCEFDPKYKRLTDKADKLDWWKLEDANSTPFHEASEEPDVKVNILELADLIKLTSQLSARIQKIIDDEDDRRVVKPEDKEAGLSLVRQLNAIKVERVKTETIAVANNDQPQPNEGEAEELQAA